MALRSVSLRLEPELWDRVARSARLLGQSQTTFVRRALEQALDGQGEPSRVPSPSPASARASVPPGLPPGMSEHEVDESPLEFRDAEFGPVVEEPLPRIARRHWAR